MKTSEAFALSVQHVSKSFGGVKALDDVSMEVMNNQITLLIGPNGSGKTTLLSTIAGLLKPDSGQIIFRGRKITGMAPNRVYALGLSRTFQIPRPFPSMTVLENILCAKQVSSGESFLFSAFGRGWYKAESDAEEEATKIMILSGLESKRNSIAATLSGGQLKLLEFARTLMGGEKLVLLDEPISGVLPRLAHEILSHVKQVRDELGITFIMVEHRLDLALSYADYVYAMNNGQIISSGTPEQVTKDKKVLEAYLGG